MLLAAQRLCRQKGILEFYSACDFSQDGQAFGGGSRAVRDPHRKWGFQKISKKRGAVFGFELRTAGERWCNVEYMHLELPTWLGTAL